MLALKWIRDNVEKFGGDPNNVTLFGESAGGCSVHYHMLSEMSQGLFHKAIAMSGTVFNPWSIVRLKSNGERLAKALGWDGAGGTKQCMQVLLKASPQSIIKAQETLLTKEVGNPSRSSFYLKCKGNAYLLQALMAKTNLLF